MTRLFCVLDTETTGLDPESDFLLEIAWDIINENFESVIPEPRTFLVDHDDWTSVFARLRSNPAVKEMHAANGLAGDLVTGNLTKPWKIADTLSGDISTTLSHCDYDSTIHLTGLSAHFDRDFLLADDNLNGLWPSPGDSDKYGKFHHRMFDVTSVKIMLDAVPVKWGAPTKSGVHRALEDVGEVVQQLRIFRDLLVGVGE